jgi:hypothetical protein
MCVRNSFKMCQNSTTFSPRGHSCSGTSLNRLKIGEKWQILKRVLILLLAVELWAGDEWISCCGPHPCYSYTGKTKVNESFSLRSPTLIPDVTALYLYIKYRYRVLCELPVADELDKLRNCSVQHYLW